MKFSGHYINVPKEFVFDKSLKPSDKIILQYLMWRQGSNDNCWPCMRTMADELGLSLDTVQRSIARLIKHKKIRKQKSSKQGRSHSNRYTVIVPKNSTTKAGNCTENQHSIVPKNSTDIVPKISTENKPVKINHEKTPTFSQNSAEFRLALLLLELILKRKPDFKKPNLQTWAKHIDRMIRLDQRKPEKIEAVIRFAQGDKGNGRWSGWQNNILSTAKLREKFDKLELAMEKIKNGNDERESRKLEYEHDGYGQVVNSD